MSIWTLDIRDRHQGNMGAVRISIKGVRTTLQHLNAQCGVVACATVVTERDNGFAFANIGTIKFPLTNLALC